MFGGDVRLRRRLEPVRVGLHPLPRTGDTAQAGRVLRVPRRLRLLRAARDRRRGGGHRGRQGRRRPDTFTDLLPTWLGKLTLLAIAIGAISANALNIYSGSMSLMAARAAAAHARRTGRGRDRPRRRRAPSWPSSASTTRRANYENFLLIIAYWIGPWLGVVLVDRLAAPRHRQPTAVRRPAATRTGPARSRCSSAVVSASGCSPTRPSTSARSRPTTRSFGDLTFEVGFVIAAVLYVVLFKALKPKLGPPVGDVAVEQAKIGT